MDDQTKRLINERIIDFVVEIYKSGFRNGVWWVYPDGSLPENWFKETGDVAEDIIRKKINCILVKKEDV